MDCVTRVRSRTIGAAISAVLTFGLFVLAGGVLIAFADAGDSSTGLPTTAVSALSLTPRLDLSLTGTRTSVIPKDDIDYQVKLSNSSSNLQIEGVVVAQNDQDQQAEASSWFAYIEYLPTGKKPSWTPIAGANAKLPNYTPAQESKITSGMSFSAQPTTSTGTIFPATGDRILAARLDPGASAAWAYKATVELTPEQAKFFTDSTNIRQLRIVTRIELATSKQEDGEVEVEREGETEKRMIGKLLATQSPNATDATIKLTTPDGAEHSFNAQNTPALANLVAGDSVTVARSFTVSVPATRGGDEAQDVYLARLRALDGKELVARANATAAASGTATWALVGSTEAGDDDEGDEGDKVQLSPARPVEAQEQSHTATEHLPILTLDKTGPESAAAGTSVLYGIALDNEGSGGAFPEVTDAVDGGQPTVVAGPASLQPGELGSATASYDIPTDRDAGPLSDTAAVTWKDSNSNTYGPVSDNFTTDVIASSATKLDAPPLDPTRVTPFHEQTSFLYEGDNPVQQGVAPGTIKPERAIVLRGRVITREGEPLSGVNITVRNGDSYGHTTSQADGEFYMAANGGGNLTIQYAKAGFIPVTRTVKAPWREYVHAADVALVPFDSAVTQVRLDGLQPSVQVARSSVVEDVDGARQSTVMFTPGTTAQMVMPDGFTQPLVDLGVRTTEFTVGPYGRAAMPADLPPSSAYTYAAEFSVDQAIAAGAQSVNFSKPVVSYTDNFLGFPTGTVVPFGYLDNVKRVWLAEDNGRVINILAEANGRATIDYDGNGVAETEARLSELEITSGELEQLANLYEPGKTLWRVALDHFSSHDTLFGRLAFTGDWNWSPLPPEGSREPDSSLVDEDQDCPGRQGGSIIGCENQTLGEEVGIVGAPVNLRYDSSRTQTPARNSVRVNIGSRGGPVAAATVTAFVAGRELTYLSAVTGPRVQLVEWDGKDVFGRRLPGRQPMNIRVSYSYEGSYGVTGSWAAFRSGVITGYRNTGVISAGVGASLPRMVFDFSSFHRTTVGGWDNKSAGLGGWSLSAHHAYDPVGRRLFMGDGSERGPDDAQSLTTVVESLGGSHLTGLYGPAGGLAVTADGVILAERWHGFFKPGVNFRLPNGEYGFFPTSTYTVGVEAGTDDALYVLTGGGILKAEDWRDGNAKFSPVVGRIGLFYVGSLAVSPDGTLYFSGYWDYGLGYLYKLAPGGQPEVLMQTGEVTDIELGLDGSLYYSDRYRSAVYKVDTEGRRTVVAGILGSRGYSGDGALATNAHLDDLQGLAIGGDGSIFISSANTRRIRRVNPEGIISTIAGNGSSSCPTDGAPPTGSSLTGVPDIEFDSEGNLVFWSTDCGAYRIKTAMPGFSDNDISIPSRDGSELYRFDETGRHLSTLDTKTGHAIYTFAYDASGQLVKITDQDGDQTQIERDGSGRPVAIVSPDGYRTTLEMQAGRLSAITDPSGGRTGLTTDTSGLLTSFTNPNGHASTFTYDPSGRLIKDENAAGGSKTLTRTESDDGYEVAVTSELGRTQTYSVDRAESGELIRKLIGSDGHATTRRFNADGRATMTSPDGTTVELTKDGDPRLGPQVAVPKSVKITTPGNRQMAATTTRTATVATPGNPLSVTNETDITTINGRSYRSRFDKLTSGTFLLGVDPGTGFAGQPTKPTGRYVDTSPAGRTTTTEVDAKNRLLRASQGGLATTAYAYDSRGRVSEALDGNRLYRFTYDQSGNLATTTDPLGRTTAYAYDLSGRLTAETLPDERVIFYTYDQNGNTTSITPPSRPAHSFTFNPLDQIDSYNAPLGASSPTPPTTRYAYDQDQALTAIHRPDGTTLDIDYDPSGRPQTLTRPEGQTTYSYNPQTGNLETISGPDNQSLDLNYDGPLPTGEVAHGAANVAVSRDYDSSFRVSREVVSILGTDPVETYPTTFDYDQDSLLTRAGSLHLVHDPQNGLQKSTTLGAVTTSTTHNSFGEPEGSQVTGSTGALFSQSYQRDSLGRITTKTETTPSGTHSFDYSYDPAGRLTQVSKDGSLQRSYQYDQNSNRTQVNESIFLNTTATYDNQDALLTYGNATYTHDQNGDLAAKRNSAGTTDYDYDSLGALTSVTLPDTGTINYKNDPLGRRVLRDAPGTTNDTKFVYGQNQGPLATVTNSGLTVKRFIYATSDSTPDYMTQGAATYRLVKDHLGSVRMVVNAETGDIAQQLTYDEFGQVTEDSNPGFQPFGFAGGLYDQGTKLTRFGARDYDAETGRWTAKDPILFAGGDTNLYGYVINDPVNFVDPSGLLPGWAERASNAAAAELNALTAGLSNEAAGAIFGFDPDCAEWGPGYGYGSAAGNVGSLVTAGGPGVKAGYQAYQFGKMVPSVTHLVGPGRAKELAVEAGEAVGRKAWKGAGEFSGEQALQSILDSCDC